MTDMTYTDNPKAGHGEHYVKPHQGEMPFKELHDATPSAKFKFTVTGWLGLIVVTFWILVAVIGPFVAPYDENAWVPEEFYSDTEMPDEFWDESEFLPGSEMAWLGTDNQGRDVMSRIIHGSGRTIGIAVAGTVLAYFLGVVLGIGVAVAGYWPDMIVSRINDAFISLPTIMLGLVVVAAVGSSVPVLILTAGAIYMTIVFRLARGIGMDIMVMDYVEAAKVRGEGIWWIVTREIWPNAAMPLISDFGLRLIYVILFISSLSFLGMGVQPPKADWGNMVRDNLGALQYGASVLPVVAPAVAIATLTVGINLIVDDISAHAGGKLSKRM